MKQQLFFVNFPKTEAIENFAEKRLVRVFDKFRRAKITAAEMWFQVENSPAHPGRDQFSCEVLVKSRLTDKPLFIKKTGDNLYDAIVAVANVLRNQLSRVHEKVVSKKDRRLRRHHRMALINDGDSYDGLVLARVPKT